MRRLFVLLGLIMILSGCATGPSKPIGPSKLQLAKDAYIQCLHTDQDCDRLKQIYEAELQAYHARSERLKAIIRDQIVIHQQQQQQQQQQWQPRDVQPGELSQ